MEFISQVLFFIANRNQNPKLIPLIDALVALRYKQCEVYVTSFSNIAGYQLAEEFALIIISIKYYYN